MDKSPSNHEDNHLFLDADDSPEPSASSSTLSVPQPVSHDPSSPATTIRRRPIRPVSPVMELPESSFDSPTHFESDLINGAKTSFQIHKNLRISKEDEGFYEEHDLKDDASTNFVEKRDVKHDEALNLADKCDLKHDAPLNLTENNEESSSIITTAMNDGELDNSADSISQLGDSSSSFLEFIGSLVIKTIEFQIKLFIMFVTYPILFMFNCCMFFIDPFGTMRKGKAFWIGIFGRAWRIVFWCISPKVERFFKENVSIWSVAFRCGWGFLWSIYVCCILFCLLVSSFLFSGFLMKFLVEKPIQIRQVLNFDYTKHSPVAYVPIISCDGIVNAAKDSENEIQVGKWVGERVIPSKQKVQVIVSLKVPESGYNRNLGIFQAKVDFLLSNGKTIASSSQPCMLRFRSEPIRLFMTFLKMVPLLTGYVSETQSLNVKMRGFVEGDLPTSCLKVTLEQRAEYQPGAGIPEIYDASLVIESQLPFFKRIMWLWKLSIYIWITMMAFVMELLLVLVCCRPIIFPRTRQRGAYARGPAN
ncbi:hypothetical protein Lal_00022540 [Lupinus albus]|uniref:Putative Seipin family protein n=1 Tax=Lupinus albus TaxID=3870 RepID=A0A6A4NZH6_LUPAL|nr:putative Seipin family protein [Lupinus albus]KAF1895043.1 hypothetical protein Lal_00022540 [Lupinus albus]